MNFKTMNKQSKIFLLGGGALIVLVLLIALLTRNGNVQVELVAVPEDAKITIDGQEAKTGKTTLKAGEHTLKATREHFYDKEIKVNTKDLTNGEKVFLVQDASDQAGLDWLYNNKGDPQLRQAAGDAAATAAQEELKNDYPFLNLFPHESISYKIDYDLSDDRKKLTFQITLMPDSRPGDTAGRKQELHDIKAQALKFLTDNGVDISKYEITYDPAEAKDL